MREGQEVVTKGGHRRRLLTWTFNGGTKLTVFPLFSVTIQIKIAIGGGERWGDV
jgi:hypothetical protein